MKIKLLADFWQQRKKDEDGNVYYVRRQRGDEFDVNDAEARHLLREDVRRPLAEKAESSTQTQQARTTSQSSGDKKS